MAQSSEESRIHSSPIEQGKEYDFWGGVTLTHFHTDKLVCNSQDVLSKWLRIWLLVNAHWTRERIWFLRRGTLTHFHTDKLVCNSQDVLPRKLSEKVLLISFLWIWGVIIQLLSYWYSNTDLNLVGTLV